MENIKINKQLAREILTYINDKGYAPNTIKAYRLDLKRLFKGHEVLDKKLVMKYLSKHQHTNQRAIVWIINQYCNENDIDFYVLVPRIKHKPRKIPEILSIEEIKIIVEASPYPYNLMLRCIFGIGAGLRISECLKLSWNNIRWSDWLKEKDYGVAILKETKGNFERVVNIPNEIMDDLYKLAKERNVLNELKIPRGGLIFPINNVGEFKKDLLIEDREKWKIEYLRYAYDWFKYNIIKNKCSKALNKKIHVHMLRHSRATYLLEVEKIPIDRIQQLLGHKDIKTTMIYARVNPRNTFEMLKNTKVI